ncbi:hypothetical protein ACF09L_19115 [Streptomyces sp. NPDC014779]|uniref:hypothetical protein n=1 Tax=Streptomyces sp. NPDC014779 TaxID=3364911 RepID=UPI0037034810
MNDDIPLDELIAARDKVRALLDEHYAATQRPADTLRAAAQRLRDPAPILALTASDVLAALLRAREPLAQWLDETATEVTAAEGTEYELLAHEPSNSWTAALAVARAILQEQP